MTDYTRPTPYRAIRESIGLSLREVARRVEAGGLALNSGRLSMIERGITPTPEEHRAIMAVLMKEIPA
jgi:hypothetical protein